MFGNCLFQRRAAFATVGLIGALKWTPNLGPID